MDVRECPQVDRGKLASIGSLRVFHVLSTYREGILATLFFACFWILLSPASLFNYLNYPQGNDIGAILIYLLCVVFLWHSTGMHPQISRSRPPTLPQSMFWAFFFASGAICGVMYWHFEFAGEMKTLPIDSKYADMLPLMLEGFKDLEQWRSPYRPHQVPWTLHNYYLPATFIPYFIAHKLNVDIRWATVMSLDLIGVVLAVSMRPWRLQGVRSVAALVIWCIAYGAICRQVSSQGFIRIIHLGPFWLWTALGFMFLSLGVYRMMAASFLLALISRESALFYLLLPVVIGLKFCRRRTLTYLVWMVSGTFLVFVPFLLDNPLFYFGNIKQYSSLGWYLKQNPNRFVGFSALFHEHGLDSLRLPLLGASMIGMGALLWRKCHLWNRGVLVVAGFAGATSFYLFALITWEYTYVCSMIIFAVWFCSIWSTLLNRNIIENPQ